MGRNRSDRHYRIRCRRIAARGHPAPVFSRRHAIVLVGHVSWLPVILRRPAFWELPIVTAVALFWSSIFFLWKYHSGHRRALWAWCAGCALGLAPGARPTYAITVGFLFLLFAIPSTRERWGALTRRMLPLIVPLVVAATLLMGYNYQRFGRILEFGQSYQLWGEDFRGKALFTAANIPINFGVYIFNLPEISPYFPFLRMAPMPMTGGYLGTEEMPGILFTMPAVLIGFLAIYHVYRIRKTAGVQPLQWVLIGAGFGGGITGIFLFSFGGGCSRYIAELLAGWSLLTGIGWLAWPQGPARPGWSRVSRILAAGAVCWSLAGAWFASFEFHNYARLTQPNVYRPIASIFNYPGHWIAEAAGRTFGPVALDIRISPEFKPGDTVVLHTGRIGMTNSLVVERLALERIRLRLLLHDKTVLFTPVMAAPAGGIIHVELHTPWLYPPTAHPYWNRFTDPVQRRRLQRVSVLATSAVSQVQPYTLIFDATQFEPYVHTASDPIPGGAWIERMRRLDPARSIAGTDLGVDFAELLPHEIWFPH